MWWRYNSNMYATSPHPWWRERNYSFMLDVLCLCFLFHRLCWLYFVFTGGWFKQGHWPAWEDLIFRYSFTNRLQFSIILGSFPIYRLRSHEQMSKQICSDVTCVTCSPPLSKALFMWLRQTLNIGRDLENEIQTEFGRSVCTPWLKI